jgi:hypothetical protein
LSRKFVPKITTIYSPLFLRDYPTVDCEAPERVSAVHSHIDELVTFLEPEPCSIADLRLCHSDSIITSVQRSVEVFEVARVEFFEELDGALADAAKFDVVGCVHSFLQGIQEACS